jgi:hypothetical protein
MGLAARLDESVEARFDQQILQLVVRRRVARRTRHLIRGHDKVALNLALSTHRHRRCPSRIFDVETKLGEGDFGTTYREAWFEGLDDAAAGAGGH